MSVTSLLADRLLEQVETWTTWERRAWAPGTILALREYIEAVEWNGEGVLSDAALDWMRGDLRKALGADQGLMQGAVRSQLEQLLRSRIRAGSQQHRRLERAVEFVREGYMDCWVTHVETGSPHLERSSRLISGFVQDLGFHPGHLRREIRTWTRSGATGEDVVRSLRDLSTSEKNLYRGVVLFEVLPHQDLAATRPEWLGSEAASTWLQEAGHDIAIRQIGGMLFETTALDAASAATEIGARVQRISARTEISGPRPAAKQLRAHPKVFFDDGSAWSLRDPTVAVRVPALATTESLFNVHPDSAQWTPLDNALQLAASLSGQVDAVAISAGWASLESLLVTGSDSTERGIQRGVAAERAANLLTAGWPRAELTRLAYKVSEDPTNNARTLRALERANTSRARAAALTAAFERGEALSVREPRDRAAILRMAALHAAPKAVLGRVHRYLDASLRRLYRQRNITLHGGSSSSVALAATKRTATPLVAATLDRLTYSTEITGKDVLDCVAHSRLAIDTAGDSFSWALYDLNL